ncbi:MAG: sulfatase-like hydrolase/transferase, partial [Anaerolineaceae bacterium]|nr:sulfatase-like hydrolase/transferase [Anaerolineaceae bacterium]
DADGDGFALEGGDCGAVDCDDGNPAVHPGAVENCTNGIDDDCDGLVDGQDEGCTCTDSDGGLNYEVAGFVVGVGATGPTPPRYDVCETGDREGWVREYYCNGTTPWPKFYLCAYGCQEGACSPPACTDADGDGFALEGGVCGEVDCDDGNLDVYPGAAEICANGIDDNCNGFVDDGDPACFPCTDSDGGLAYFRQGTVMDLAGNSFVDACTGTPGQLAEYYCDASLNVQSEVYSCPGSCVDGACYVPNVVLIGWDGVQRDHLLECYNRELPECSNGLPNLQQLSGGMIYSNTTTSGSTCTKPGWAQLVSGYDAEVMGIYDLDIYQPLPEGYSIFEKVEDYLGPDNVVTMFVSAKGVHTGGACIGDPTLDDGVPAIEDKGQPYCITKNYLDYFELDLVRNPDIGNRALALLEAHQDDPFLALFLWRDPDVTGHLIGENSTQYTSKLLELDGWLGQVVTRLQQLGIYDRTLVYVVTDHGFDEGTSRHQNAPYGFLASNDPGIVRDGDRKDLAPTILERYGITTDAVGSAPAVNGHSLLAFPPLACIPEGQAYIDYPGAPACCSGLTLIGFDIKVGMCVPPTGGTGDASGYCTACGDGVCAVPENMCNCPQDCER